MELTTQFIARQVELGRSQVEDPAGVANALILMNNAVINDNLARAHPDSSAKVAKVVAEIWNRTIYGDHQ